MRPKPDDPLLALGLPRAWSFTPVQPRFDTHLAVWSVFAVDHIAADYYTHASLSMCLANLAHIGLIDTLQVFTPVSKHLLLKAQFRYTRQGARVILSALQARYQDEDE